MDKTELDRLRGLVDLEYEPATHQVSRLDILKFCSAIRETRSVHVDPVAAKRAGHPDLLAPTSFYASLGFSRGSVVERERLGADGLPVEGSLEGARIVAGETHVRFFGTIHAGDRITVRQRLLDVYPKAGTSGLMIFFVYERTYARPDGELVVEERYSRIARP
jgi:acyl dehydratase